MQSHASRHVVSERLQDLHPDLSPPFLKVRLARETVVAGGRSRAQHRQAVLAQRTQEVVKDEISVAFGRRGIQKVRGPAVAWADACRCTGALPPTARKDRKRVRCSLFHACALQLVDVLTLEPAELTDEQRAHALRVFIGLLSTQEHKTDAIAVNAAVPITWLVRESQSPEVRRCARGGHSETSPVRGHVQMPSHGSQHWSLHACAACRLSCECLSSMAMVRAGRESVVAAQGLEALTEALQTTPEAAADALRVS